MSKEQLVYILGFSSTEEMELYYDTCEGYFISGVPSKQDCSKIIEEWGLHKRLNDFQSMSNNERMAYELHDLTGALNEAVSVGDYKTINSILTSILKKTTKLQECNYKELEQSSNLTK